MRQNRQVAAWALWDWGSAAFNAVMVTFVFSAYLASDAFGPDARGTTVLSVGNMISGIIVALTAPVVGARADASGNRKRQLGLHTAIVVVLIAACFFVRPEEGYLYLGVVLIAAGNVFFEFAEVSYNSLLLRVSSPATIGRISGIGWGAGYLGGIVLLLIVYIGFVSGETHWFGITSDDALNIRVVAVVAALWFGLFAIPIFVSLPADEPVSGKAKVSWAASYRQLWQTLKDLWHGDRNTIKFLIASAVYRDGLGAVFAYGAILGTQVFGLDPADVILFAIVANVVAAAGSFVGGWLDDRIGPLPVIYGSLIGMIIVGTIMFFQNGPEAFWGLGLALCLFVGPAQSASRAFLGRLTNIDTAGELYGLYATTGRSIAFLAPGLVALLMLFTKDERFVIVAIVVILIAGALSLLTVKNQDRVGTATETITHS
ncbi:MFS transporter [Micrococcoides hystricis]|uniref:MFS transporter n=1 Tax=Micrococcoides hystricis TaxID=1572761 RepID=A0ABV6PEY5_9MICC